MFRLKARLLQINDAIEYNIKERLKEHFDVLVSGVDVGAIEIDKTSEGFCQLMAVTRDIAAARIESETQDYVERLRIQREEGQYAMHKQTQSANIGAFTVEKQAEVGVAGAQALGQMGANGAGDVNLGSSSEGFNMGAMMASIAVGGAVGQNIAGAMNQVMGNMSQTSQPQAVPPAVPTTAYHVAFNGQATGPFELSVLAQMTVNGQLTVDSLVWKSGMPQWAKAGTVPELQALFASSIPPIPPIEQQ